MERRTWWPRGWRGLALLVVAGVMLANLISPAIANIGTVNHLWKQHIRPKADARYLPVRTRLTYQGGDSDATIGYTFELMRTVGTFTKASAGTTVMLTWIGHAMADGDFCDFQLRIDGTNDLGSTSLVDVPDNQDSMGRAIMYSAEGPVSVTGLFQGLSAGTHSVEIYVRGSATSCTLNWGNFPQQVIVEETLQLTGNGTVPSPALAPREQKSGS